MPAIDADRDVIMEYPNPRPNELPEISDESDPVEVHPGQMELPTDPIEVSRIGQIRQLGSDLGKIVLSANREDIIRGMSRRF
jgi:hypothetical protein